MTYLTSTARNTAVNPNATSISNRADTCVLVADDDENDVFLLRRAFQKAGFSHAVVHVKNGQEAIDYLAESAAAGHSRPDLLVLDLKLPLLDGFDVLSWLRQRQLPATLPVVVFSSSSLPRDEQKARELGAQDYVVKPDAFDQWKTIAQGLHDRWLNNGNHVR